MNQMRVRQDDQFDFIEDFMQLERSKSSEGSKHSDNEESSRSPIVKVSEVSSKEE